MSISKSSFCVQAFLWFYSSAASGAADLSTDIIPEIQVPPFGFLRQYEEWSILRDIPEFAREGYGGKFKYVELSENGSIWASLGGHLRGRLESWDNFGFGTPAEDKDEFALGRLLVHGDLHFGDKTRLFVEAKSAFSTDRSLPGRTRTLDVDEFDIQQAFVDFKSNLGEDSTITFRFGRQSLLFGKQRLVSPLPWGNTLRSWDGVTAIVNSKDWTITGFWTQFAPVDKFDFNKADSDVEFYGGYLSSSSTFLPFTNFDFYGLGLRRKNVSVNGTQADEDRTTIGGRLYGAIPNSNIDYDLEMAYQLGDFGRRDIEAFMYSSQIAYSLGKMKLSPRLHLGLDYASGDDRENELGTFNQLFPLGHAYLGFIDIIGRQNIIDVNPGVRFNLPSRWVLTADLHQFWRASESDSVYNAGGGVVRGVNLDENPRGSKYIGAEIDFTLQYSLNRNISVLAGYSRFMGEDYIEESGSSDNIGFLYFQTQFTF